MGAAVVALPAPASCAPVSVVPVALVRQLVQVLPARLMDELPEVLALFAEPEWTPSQQAACLHDVLAGYEHLVPAVLAVFERARIPAEVFAAPASPLSRGQAELLRQLAEGRSNKEIAKDLVLAEATVKSNCLRLFRRLGVHDRSAAVAIGFRKGWLR